MRGSRVGGGGGVVAEVAQEPASGERRGTQQPDRQRRFGRFVVARGFDDQARGRGRSRCTPPFVAVTSDQPRRLEACSAAWATACFLSSSDMAPGCPAPGHGVNSNSRRASERARTA